jgi:hypothetical protein
LTPRKSKEGPPDRDRRSVMVDLSGLRALLVGTAAAQFCLAIEAI